MEKNKHCSSKIFFGKILNFRENYFEKALKHDQDFGQVYFHLAKSHFFRGNEEKAHECFEKAMSLLYKFPEPIQYEIKSKYFVLVEAKHTFVGKEKELFYQSSRKCYFGFCCNHRSR